MSLDNLEGFEAWLAEREQKRAADGWYPYSSREISLMRCAWQASRAAAVVELPAIEAWDNDGRLDRERDEDAGERIGLVPLIDVRIALEEAGVTVK